MYKSKLFTVLLAAASLVAGCEKDKAVETTVFVSTSAITNITSESATGGGDVDLVGIEALTERGVCWSTTPDPTTASSKAAAGSGKGNFSAQLTGLTAGDIYYARAYVINNGQTYYGKQVKFEASTPAELIQNGNFELPGDAGVTDVNSLPSWKTDEMDGGVIGRGSDDRNTTNYIWTYNTSKSFYQEVGKVPAAQSNYAISFDANYDWTDWGDFNAEVGVIFSAYSGSDPTTRVVIDTVKIETGNFPGWGNNWGKKTASFSIPAGSPYADQNLVIEFDVLPYVDPSNGDIWDNTVWYQFDNISVIQTLK